MFRLIIFSFLVVTSSSHVPSSRDQHSSSRISCAFQYLKLANRPEYYVVSNGVCQTEYSSGSQTSKQTTEVWYLSKKSATKSRNQRSFIFRIADKSQMCPELHSSDTSMVTYSSLVPGAEAEYSCKSNYSRFCSGKLRYTVRCLFNGKWESFNDTCIRYVWTNPQLDKEDSFVSKLQCRMKTGSALVIIGSADEFISINLYQNEINLFHMAVYLKDKGLGVVDTNKRRIIMNSYLKGRWGIEMKYTKFNITQGEVFNITIHVVPQKFNVYIHEQLFMYFKHRVRFQYIDRIKVTGKNAILKRVEVQAGM